MRLEELKKVVYEANMLQMNWLCMKPAVCW